MRKEASVDRALFAGSGVLLVTGLAKMSIFLFYNEQFYILLHERKRPPTGLIAAFSPPVCQAPLTKGLSIFGQIISLFSQKYLL
jgi:hypothetical protein